MAHPTSVSIPVEHFCQVHEVETFLDLEQDEAPEEVSLFELVEAVAEYSDSEREVVATVMHMLRSGRVQLRGIAPEPMAAKLCG